MLQITRQQTATLKDWFLPDRPGPLIGLHIIQTGNGTCFVDRWPEPRTLLVDTGGNYSFAGDHAALEPGDLQERVTGFVEAPEGFVPLLKAAFPELVVWERMILDLSQKPRVSSPHGALIRRIEPADTYRLWELGPETAWIGKTWGGLAGLAASRLAWGAFIGGRLASVACPFFVGERYEDIGVATEPLFRGAGLGPACAGALCVDIQDRGRRPSWTTSPDNSASLRVAEKLGFEVKRRDCLYVVGIAVPETPWPEVVDLVG